MDNSDVSPQKRLKLDNNSHSSKATASLLQLSDDCLVHLFQFYSQRDWGQLALVCQRFRKVLLLPVFTNCYKKLSIRDTCSWTLKELNDYLELAGSFVETLEGILSQKYNNNLAECIGKHCHHIKEATLYEVNNKCLQSALLNCGDSLVKLVLQSSNVTDNGIAWLRKMTQLEHLQVKFSDQLTGKHFEKLTHLKRLTLDQCEKFTPSALLTTCKALEGLKRLDVQSCTLLRTGSALNPAINQCPSLKWLTLTTAKGLSVNTPQLKGVEIRPENYSNLIKPLSPNFFKVLAQGQADNLKVLRVYTFYDSKEIVKEIAKFTQLEQLCLSGEKLDDKCLKHLTALKKMEYLEMTRTKLVTKDAMFEILSESKCLKFFCVYGSTFVTEEFIFDVLEMLRKQSRQLWIDIRGTNVKIEDILKNQRYLEAEAVLKFYAPPLVPSGAFDLDTSKYEKL